MVTVFASGLPGRLAWTDESYPVKRTSGAVPGFTVSTLPWLGSIHRVPIELATNPAPSNATSGRRVWCCPPPAGRRC